MGIDMTERTLAAKKTEVKAEAPSSQMRKVEHPLSINSPVEQILFLQRTAGNQAVQKLIKSRALQAKLKISQPNDIHEQEADRVAEQIMRMPDPVIQQQTKPEEEKEEVIQTKPLVTHITPLVHRQVEEENEEEPIQKKEADQISEVPSDIHAIITSLQGGGQPLSDQVRSYFEPRFGQDFGHVRVHTDSNAILATKAINAKAFTVGHDVVFGAGQYKPNSIEGKWLLGHELTHVVQQGGQRNSINTKEESDEKLSWWEGKKKWLGEKAEKAKELLFEKALDAAGVPKEQMMGLIKKAGNNIREIFENPGRFLGTLIKAIGQGFIQFKDRIGEHLKAGFMSWLFGTMIKAGIELPKDFSLKSILMLVMQVLGITTNIIRQKFVKFIGEKNIKRFEKAWQVISTMMSEGIGGLWNMLKEYLGNLKEMVVDEVRSWVITEIIKSAVLKVASMFNPVSGLITIIKTIYNVIKFLLERAYQIKDLFAAILDSVVELAMGSISSAANKIEQALARLIPIAIGFLASLLGISGITDKIKEIIKRVSSMVDKAIDKVIEKAAKVIGSVGKIPGSGKEKAVPSKTENAPALEPLTMSGTSHELILISGPSPKIEFASQNRGLLSNKIGKVIGQLMRQDPKPEDQINDLKKIAKKAKDIQKKALELRKNPQNRLNKVPEFKDLATNIEKYSQDYQVNDIKHYLSESSNAIKIGEDLSIPEKGRSRAQVISITDTHIVLKIKSKSVSGDITSYKRKDIFEKWVAEGKVIRWSLECQRLRKKREPYKQGLVEEVWERAKDENKRVFSPHPPRKELFWDPKKNRWDQWHMGHKPKNKYSKLVDDFCEEKITWEEFMKIYNNSENYWPELPLENMSHEHEL